MKHNGTQERARGKCLVEVPAFARSVNAPKRSNVEVGFALFLRSLLDLGTAASVAIAICMIATIALYR